MTESGSPEDGTADLVGRALDHGLLRPALELAVVVARAGADARPPIPPPGPLRPLLRHAKWTPRARTSVARVIDTDEEFRMRVAEAAEHLDAEQFGVESRLWLVRPGGWQEALGEAVGALDLAEEERKADRDERQARRQVESLSAELARRQGEFDEALRRAGELEAELVDARRERRELLTRAGALDEQLVRTQAEVDRWRESAESAESAAEAHRRMLAEAVQEVADLRDEEARLRRQIAHLEEALGEAEARQEADSTAAADLRQSVARAVGEAAAAAGALGEALSVAARNLLEARGTATQEPGTSEPRPADGQNGPDQKRPPPATIPSSSAALRSSAGDTDTAMLEREKQAGGERPPARRQPQPLPPAVFEDSPEAAAHLVRSGVLLLVDGYNVSLFGWPELPLPAQRHRVTTSLAELAARTGASVRVIFDGDEQIAYPEVRGGARTPVRVRFSDPGVDADEVIIGQVEEHPADRAVVVATNDRRVQEEVRRRGANVITTPQLLTLLRRVNAR